jgi:8-oxo-dGTP pyrophosphatase MutT (NUDIX family)
MTLSVDLARRALAALTPAETFESSEGRSHAAVAAILRDAPNPGSDEPPTLEALFIKRATHEHDPWSGHMAFPGGRHVRGDLTLLRTAMRETEEEVGLDLSTAELLGGLPPIVAMARGRRTNMLITPYVFGLLGHPALTLNPKEVDQALWFRLSPMFHKECATEWQFEAERLRYRLPAFDVGGHVIWGLTYQMLDSLFEHFRNALAGS